MNKWDSRFFNLAKEVATWSKDPDCKVGVLIVSTDRRLFTSGYNGLPQGVKDDKRLTVKHTKNCLTVHAELNAILNARRDLTGWTLYATKPPCVECAKAIIQAGIVNVYCPSIDVDSDWANQNILALNLFKEAKIGVKLIRDGV